MTDFAFCSSSSQCCEMVSNIRLWQFMIFKIQTLIFRFNKISEIFEYLFKWLGSKSKLNTVRNSVRRVLLDIRILQNLKTNCLIISINKI